MERLILKAENNRDKKRNSGKEKAILDFEKMRGFWQGVTKINGIKIEPAPQGLDTFAFDLVEKKIYVSDRFEHEEGGDRMNSFALGHELGHMEETLEVLQMPAQPRLGRKSGLDFFENEYIKRIEKDRAFALTDNCISDIAINYKLMKKVPNLKSVEIEAGKNLFSSDDFTQIQDQNGNFHRVPKHIQLPQALLVEARYKNGKQVNVDEDVREAMERIKSVKSNGKNIIELIQDEKIDLYTRYLIQNKFIMPEVYKLKEKDIEDKRNSEKKRESEKNDKEKANDGSGGEENQNQPRENKSGKSAQEKNEKSKKEDRTDDVESDKIDSKKSEESASLEDKENNQGKMSREDDDSDSKTFNYSENFDEEYKRAEEQNISQSDISDLKNEIKKWKEESSDPEKTRAKKKAEALGVNVEDMLKYESISSELERKGMNESIDKIIERIILERLKSKNVERGPVLLSEGDDIDDFATILSESRVGNFDPKVSNVFDRKESKGEMFGEIEISLIGDRSASMAENDGSKLRSLQEAVVWVMNAQKNLQDKLSEAESGERGLYKGLKVNWEVRSFMGDRVNDSLAVFPMSDDFSEKKRIDALAHFKTAPGMSTPDYIPLEKVAFELIIDDEKKKKLEDRELKKVVILITDGKSDNANKAKSALDQLNKLGVVVIAIGIGKEAESVKTTYGESAVWVDKIENLLPELVKKVESEFMDLLPLRKY